jgi:succinylarginine dihydrolase
VFHNDVIAMNTGTHMVVHEQAFIKENQEQIKNLFAQNPDWKFYEVKTAELSVSDAVKTYLFNSQLLQIDAKKHVLVAPSECSNHAGSRGVVDRLISGGIIDAVHYLDVHESMRNGGGPACLRLRIVMTPEQSGAMHPGIILTDARYEMLKEWITTHYRDRLAFDDLRDPEFVRELDAAYEALEPILEMPGLYDEWRVEF